MNIYLVGMMGAGKSVTGKALAPLLKMQFVDLDRMIETDQKLSVSEIFEIRGEPFFRELESEVLKRVSGRSGQVISTGGGIVLRKDNRQLMKQNGRVVFLETSVPWLLKRLRGSTERPLLKTENWTQKVETLAEERASLYREASNITVLTDEKTPAQTAEEIAVKLGVMS